MDFCGFAPCGNLDGIQSINKACHVVYGIAVTEGTVGVTAFGADLHFIALGANGTGNDMTVAAIEADKFLQTTAIGLHQLLTALQITQAFFTAVQNDENTGPLGAEFILGNVLCNGHQRGDVCGVVANAGAVDLSILNTQGKGLQVREHHINMGAEGNEIIAAGIADRVDHIPCFVDIHACCPQGFQPGLAELGAFFLVMGGCGNLRQFNQQIKGFLTVCIHIRVAKQYDKARQTLQKHLEMPNATWADERCASMRYIAKCCIAQNDVNDAKKWLHNAIAQAPYLREPYIDFATLCYAEQNWHGVIFFATKALEIKHRSLSYINEPQSWGAYPYDLLSIAYFYINDLQNALLNCKIACTMSKEERLHKNKQFFESKAKN